MALCPISLSLPTLQYFYSEMRGVDQENEVNRILGAFKLNPYEQLGLRFDCDASALRRQYRRSSLMVHPDKCPHPRAKDAFEILGAALKHLEDPERKSNLDNALSFAKEELLKDWRKATKHDAGVRLAASLDARGMEGVEAAHVATPAFAEAWKARSREVLGRAEWRRRRMSKRIKEEEERGREEHRLEKQLNKNIVEHEKAWEKGRTERVGTWRDFVAKKAKKSKGGPVGGIKPPKVRETDDDRRYIQRVTTEEFRPGKK